MMLDRHKLSTFFCEIGVSLGSIVVFSACVSYFILGFHFATWATWSIGLAICASRFYMIRATNFGKISRLDIISILALFIAALPIYLWSIYTVPYQVSADEVAGILKEQTYVRGGLIDIFGLSEYYGFTSFHFLLQGWLSQFLGGINLYHVRLVHASAGVLIIPCSFVFFRVIGLRWLLAITATIFICANHALVGISRMASITNFSLLFELCALALLFDGFKRKCPFTTYLGGLAAGFGFYVYYPARIVVPLWLVFLFILSTLRPNAYPGKELRGQLAVCALGLVLAVAPLAVAHLRQPGNAVDAFEFQKRQCMLFPEGRELAKSWTSEHTVAEGIKQNIWNGLTAFNNNISDYGWTYENPDHGFVDPLSGVLLWVGFLAVLCGSWAEPPPILMISGFLMQLFLSAFIVTKAPNYTRLLIMLPFVAYFIAQGIQSTSSLICRPLKQFGEKYTRATHYAVFLSAMLAIVFWNCAIFNDFISRGTTHGDPIGSTVRFVEDKNRSPFELFITAASTEYPYYAWESPSNWTSRVEPFLTADQACRAFTPDDLTAIQVKPPVTFFMNGGLWNWKQEALRKMYPNLVVYKLYDKTGLVAVEDAGVTPDSATVHAAYKHWSDCLSRIEYLRRENHHEEAEQLCLAALKAPEALVNGSDFKARVLLELGTAQGNRKKYAEAEKTLLDAMKLRSGLAGHQDNESVCFADALANFYSARKRWADAEVWFTEVNKIRAAGQDAYSDQLVPFYAGTYRSLALVCWHQKKYQEAEENYEKASSLYRRHPERSTWEAAAIRQDLELCHQDRLLHDRLSRNH